jgi:hypothetical protein
MTPRAPKSLRELFDTLEKDFKENNTVNKKKWCKVRARKIKQEIRPSHFTDNSLNLIVHALS